MNPRPQTSPGPNHHPPSTIRSAPLISKHFKGSQRLKLISRANARLVLRVAVTRWTPPGLPLAFAPNLRNNASVPLTVTQLTDRLVASYARAGGINHLDGEN